MSEIIFVTGNKGKVNSIQRHIKRLGINLTVTQQKLDLMEPQANTATEVSRHKARQAYKLLKQPVLVDDSSFHIAALGGFPGPYIKYMLTTIGIDGILSFMKGKTDRGAYFLSSLVFIDEAGQEHLFEDAPYPGNIVKQIDDYDSETAWSELYKIFIPDGSDKVLARMTDVERNEIDSNRTDSYNDFCLWVKDNVS
jgi:non-canonical purine NTP pyrophosphatase (RdgB/HAM1 family)